jgi:hypothetical protein
LQILVIDFSIQGDASVILLGGTGEPDADQQRDARTRGGGRVAQLPLSRTSGGFASAAFSAADQENTAAAAAVALASSDWSSFWASRKQAAPEPAAAAPAPFDWL